MFRVQDELNEAKESARSVIEQNKHKAKILSLENTNQCLRDMGSTFSLVFQEKEILFLAALQWMCILFGYLLFIEALDWIPDNIWRAIDEAHKQDRDGPGQWLSLALFAWSFIVVGLVSFPLAILNAAMISVYTQKVMLGSSTLLTALLLGVRNLGRIYAFTFVDGWITAYAVFDRLPRKRHNRTALDEALYYAWKLGTFAVMPALVNGRGFVDAGKETITLIKKEPLRAIGLRFGYSLLCWIVGIAAYIVACFWIGHADIVRGSDNWVFRIYQWLFIPLVGALGIVTVCMRPFYLLSITKLYAEQIGIDEHYFMQPTDTSTGFKVVTAIFLFVLIGMLCVASMPDQVGITGLFSHLADLDLQSWQKTQH